MATGWTNQEGVECEYVGKHALGPIGSALAVQVLHHHVSLQTDIAYS